MPHGSRAAVWSGALAACVLAFSAATAAAEPTLHNPIPDGTTVYSGTITSGNFVVTPNAIRLDAAATTDLPEVFAFRAPSRSAARERFRGR